MLLILAGVTISLVVGDNGIIGKTKDAKENMTNAQGEENEQLKNLQNYIEEIGGTTTPQEPTNPNIKEYHNGVPIPKGFYYVGGEKETGLVISDNPLDENKVVGQTDITVPKE